MRVLHLSDIHYSLGAKDARRGADGCGDNAHGAVAEVGDRPLSLPAAEFYPAMVDRLGDVLPAFEACLREGLAADDAGERVGAIVLTGDFVERGGVSCGGRGRSSCMPRGLGCRGALHRDTGQPR